MLPLRLAPEAMLVPSYLSEWQDDITAAIVLAGKADVAV